jgi:DNA repair protein RecN (Recombination protein N)
MHLEDARFKVELRKLDTLGPNGAEDVEFLFSGNPKLPLSPLSKAISGGELSRFLISLFDVMTGLNTTMVLDEIDMGMSGKVLSSVARKLRDVSRKNQIIAVTHSPQVAAMADRMFKVERSPSNEITIRQLSEEEFESEIAVMISGKRTVGSLKAARELLERR